MKKLSNLLLAHFSTRLLAVLAMLTVCGSAVATVHTNDILTASDGLEFKVTWDSDTDKGEITALVTSGQKSVTIPSSIDRKVLTGLNQYSTHHIKITKIADNIFTSHASVIADNISTLTIPEDTYLETIGEHAFDGAPITILIWAPENKTLPSSLTASLNKNTLVEVSTRASVGDEAFMGFTALERLTIGGSATYVGKNAFSGCNHLNWIYFNSPVFESIGDYAFRNIIPETLTLPKTLKSIGEGAFYGSSILKMKGADDSSNFVSGKFSMPASLESLGIGAFEGCSKLKTFDITRATQITSLPANLLANTPLTTINGLTSRIQSIGAAAFLNAPLTSIDLSATSITEISNRLFSRCINLTQVKLPASNSITSIGDSAFYFCSSLKSLTGLDNVNTVNSYAFSRADLSEFTMPDKITKIGSHAFAESQIAANATLNIPSNCAEIGAYAFANCKFKYINFRPLYIHSTPVIMVSSIHNYAFYNAEQLLELVWPYKVTTINTGVCAGCKSLKKLTLDAEITHINRDAFSNTALTEVTLPSTVVYLAAGSFQDCLDLKVINCEMPSATSDISKTAFSLSNTYYSNRDKYIYDRVAYVPYVYNTTSNWKFKYSFDTDYVPTHKALRAHSYRVEPTEINCYRGDASIKIDIVPYPAYAGPPTVESDNSAIASVKTTSNELRYEVTPNKEGTTNIRIKGSPATTPATCLVVVKDIETITLSETEYTLLMPNTLQLTATITPSAAHKDLTWTSSDETVVTVDDKGLVTPVNQGWATITAHAPNGVTATCEITVKQAEVKLDNSSVTLKPGETTTLTASVDGGVNWSSEDTSIATVSSDGKVTAVSDGMVKITAQAKNYSYAKTECIVLVTSEDYMYVGNIYYQETASGNVKVTNMGFGRPEVYGNSNRIEYKANVTIPANIDYGGKRYDVTEIGDYAFFRMQQLESVTLPASIKSIGNMAFCGCENLYTVSMKSGISTIGYSAFQGCLKLDHVEVPNTVVSIGNAAFRDCKRLSTLTLSPLLTAISDDLCHGCEKLDNVNLPTGVVTIGKSAFRDCEQLSALQYPAALSMIDEYAFAGCTALTDANLPSKVVSLQNNAYDGCTALQTVVTPSTLQGIGAFCFNGCSALQSIEFKTTTRRLSFGESAFKGCVNMNKVTVANLDYWAMSYFANPLANPLSQAHNLYLGTTKQTAVALSTAATYVGQYAFTGCTDLTSLTLPSSVTAISDGIAPAATTVSKAAGCLDLSSRTDEQTIALDRQNLLAMPGTEVTLESLDGVDVNWKSDNTTVATVTSDGKVTCLTPGSTVITATSKTNSDLKGYCLVTVSVAAPAYVGAFYYDLKDGTATLTNMGNGTCAIGTDRYEYAGILSLPESVTYAGIDYSVSEVGGFALYGMKHLQKVIVPAAYTMIGAYGLADSENMQRISFATGSKMSTIIMRAFSGCKKLDCVELPAGVKVINNSVFRDCESLASISYPSALSMIDEYAFAGCTSLTSVTLPSTVASVQAHAYDGCSALKTYVASSSLQGIGAFCFNDCEALTSIQFKTANPMSFGEDAFHGCSALNKVEVADVSAWAMTYFPNAQANPLTKAHHLYKGGSEVKTATLTGATFVGQYAFAGADNLTTLTLPATVKAVSDGFAPTTTTVNYADAEHLPLDLSTRNPEEEIEINYSSLVLNFGDVVYLTALCSDDVNWTSDNTSAATVNSEGKVTVTGMGVAVITASSKKNPEVKGKCMVTVVAMSPMYVGGIYYTANADGTASVSNIGQGDALNTPFGKPRSEYGGIISIPASVTYGGEVYPVTAIEGNAFYNMKHLQKVIIPSTVTQIGARAFESAERMARVEFASGSKLNALGMRAFYECKQLDEVVLPDGLTTIDKHTFYNCESLADITLSATLTTIDEYAFSKCTALETIALPASVSALQNYAFSNDTKLNKIEIPESMNGIGEGCFSGCTALVDLHFKNLSQMTVDANAFLGCSALGLTNVDHLDAWAMTNFSN